VMCVCFIFDFLFTTFIAFIAFSILLCSVDVSV